MRRKEGPKKASARADLGRDSVKGFGPAERIAEGCFRSSSSTLIGKEVAC